MIINIFKTILSFIENRNMFLIVGVCKSSALDLSLASIMPFFKPPIFLHTRSNYTPVESANHYYSTIISPEKKLNLIDFITCN